MGSELDGLKLTTLVASLQACATSEISSVEPFARASFIAVGIPEYSCRNTW